MVDYIYLKLQNPWWENQAKIDEDDKIEEFSRLRYQYQPDKVLRLPMRAGDVHLITGPRQTGKSTAMKLLIKKLLRKGMPAKKIFYFNCDALSSGKELTDLLVEYQQEQGKDGQAVVCLDEISSVDEWPASIKWLADTGLTRNLTLLLTGSSSINLKKSGELLPGRRGQGEDIIYLPISFYEYLKLLGIATRRFKLDEMAELKEIADQARRRWKDFMYSGGFLRNINYGVQESTNELYLKTLRSELFKAGKKEDNLREVVRKLVSSLSAQTSYTNIAQEAELGSKNTAIDYVNFLGDSFFVKETKFWDVHQRKLLLKKNKKFYTVDPYVLWLFCGFVYGQLDFQAYQTMIEEPKQVENFVATELVKQGLQFYFYQNATELDFVIPERKWGIEVKYKHKITSADLKSLQYAEKKILVSQSEFRWEAGVTILPAYLFPLIEWG